MAIMVILKTINVSEKTWKDLSILKLEMGFPTIEEVIIYLLNSRKEVKQK